jgi:hypothetical protein
MFQQKIALAITSAVVGGLRAKANQRNNYPGVKNDCGDQSHVPAFCTIW